MRSWHEVVIKLFQIIIGITDTLLVSSNSIINITIIITEQATVGVRKLQHFLCKDPTAYGATGQNWIPFLSAVHWLNALCHSKHCCTVVYRPCFQCNHWQCLAISAWHICNGYPHTNQKTKKPKKQKNQKKQKDKTQHSASDPLPLGCAILVFLFFLVFWFLGFLVFWFVCG